MKPHSTFRFGGLGFTRERFFLQLKVPFQHIIWRAGRVDFQLKARRFSLAWVTRDDDHKIRSAEAQDYDVSLALMGSKNWPEHVHKGVNGQPPVKNKKTMNSVSKLFKFCTHTKSEALLGLFGHEFNCPGLNSRCTWKYSIYGQCVHFNQLWRAPQKATHQNLCRGPAPPGKDHTIEW